MFHVRLVSAAVGLGIPFQNRWSHFRVNSKNTPERDSQGPARQVNATFFGQLELCVRSFLTFAVSSADLGALIPGTRAAAGL